MSSTFKATQPITEAELGYLTVQVVRCPACADAVPQGWPHKLCPDCVQEKFAKPSGTPRSSASYRYLHSLRTLHPYPSADVDTWFRVWRTDKQVVKRRQVTEFLGVK